MKHIKSIILTLLTALLALPAFAQDFTYGGITYTIIDKGSKTCKTRDGWYNPDNIEQRFFPGTNWSWSTLTIPAVVTYNSDEYNVISLGDYAFCMCSKLQSVYLPESVTSIGKYAFYHCSGLTSVNIPESVISIGEEAFLQCTSLTSINIPHGVTSIEQRTFSGCSSLISINIPDGVTSI